MFWDNTSTTWAWWSGVDTGYINLDWALLPSSPTGLDGELIDGFTFSIGTNNMDPAGETYAVYYFDSCTGWGNMGVQETGFLFTGLPNGAYLPTLPPGWGWIWTISVDLEGSGYEFPLNSEWGQGISRWSFPTMGGSGLGLADAGYGSENAFDIYYPDGTYNGTWWFGSTNWASWPQALMGPQAPALGMAYYGQGAQGNDLSLYTLGNWSSTSGIRFILKKNGSNKPGKMGVSMQADYLYNPYHDCTRLIGIPITASPLALVDDLTGDFCSFSGVVPPKYYNYTYYFQGGLLDGFLELSNGVRSN